MNKGVSSFLRGMGTGVAAGITVAAVGSMMVNKNHKSLKKTVGKAVKAVGTFVDDVQSIVR